MILSDVDLLAEMGADRLIIKRGDQNILGTLQDGSVQPASVDLTLGDGFLEMVPSMKPLDPAGAGLEDMITVERRTHRDQYGEYWTLRPGGFALMHTAESVQLSSDLVARVEGKSSLGRLGLIVHATAGFVDPGWLLGTLTLELANLSPRPIKLRPGMGICQLSVHRLSSPAARPYGSPGLNSKYVGGGLSASKYRLRQEHYLDEDAERLLREGKFSPEYQQLRAASRVEWDEEVVMGDDGQVIARHRFMESLDADEDEGNG
jgi:dCTP deaminase